MHGTAKQSTPSYLTRLDAGRQDLPTFGWTHRGVTATRQPVVLSITSGRARVLPVLKALHKASQDA